MSTRFCSRDGKLFLADFVCVKPQDCYVHVPTENLYGARD
jgi:hypothetical protein